MTNEQFREKVWKLLFLADYCTRYWSEYEFWLGLLSGGVKALLGLSSVLALVGLLLDVKYQFGAAVIGSVSGLLATVILPAFGLDTVLERVISVRHDWIEVRDGYQSVWDSIDDEGRQNLAIRLEVWESRDRGLEQRSMGLPLIRKFQRDAYAETEKLCGQ